MCKPDRGIHKPTTVLSCIDNLSIRRNGITGNLNILVRVSSRISGRLTVNNLSCAQFVIDCRGGSLVIETASLIDNSKNAVFADIVFKNSLDINRGVRMVRVGAEHIVNVIRIRGNQGYIVKIRRIITEPLRVVGCRHRNGKLVRNILRIATGGNRSAIGIVNNFLVRANLNLFDNLKTFLSRVSTTARLRETVDHLASENGHDFLAIRILDGENGTCLVTGKTEDPDNVQSPGLLKIALRDVRELIFRKIGILEFLGGCAAEVCQKLVPIGNFNRLESGTDKGLTRDTKAGDTERLHCVRDIPFLGVDARGNMAPSSVTYHL